MKGGGINKSQAVGADAAKVQADALFSEITRTGTVSASTAQEAGFKLKDSGFARITGFNNGVKANLFGDSPMKAIAGETPRVCAMADAICGVKPDVGGHLLADVIKNS